MTNYPSIDIKVELVDENIEDNIEQHVELMEDLIKNHEKNRNILREMALREFTKERAGEGTKDLSSNYRYNVETLEGGGRIYITRPAFLNKGFDFVIHVENVVFMNGKDHPRHEDILNDIKKKVEFISEDLRNDLKEDLYCIFEKVYYCVDIELIMENFEMSDESFLDLPGYSLEMLLKVIKWFYIEQDMCYWNYSGRTMFLNGLKNILKTS